MRALFAGLLALALLTPGAARAQDSDGPVALVVDPGATRLNHERLRRSLAAVLGREVLRVTDERADAASVRLVIAHESGTRWLVRAEVGGQAASIRERVSRPGTLDDLLSRAAARVILEARLAAVSPPPPRPAEQAPDAAAAAAAVAALPPTPPPPPPRRREPLLFSWTDEILDPFAGAAHPLPRRELAIYTEVLDPFAPAAARRIAWSEVLDPWER